MALFLIRAILNQLLWDKGAFKSFLPTWGIFVNEMNEAADDISKRNQCLHSSIISAIEYEVVNSIQTYWLIGLMTFYAVACQNLVDLIINQGR